MLAHGRAALRPQADAQPPGAFGQFAQDPRRAGEATFPRAAGPAGLLDGPGQPGLDRACGGVDVMAIKAQPGLQSQTIARA